MTNPRLQQDVQKYIPDWKDKSPKELADTILDMFFGVNAELHPHRRQLYRRASKDIADSMTEVVAPIERIWDITIRGKSRHVIRDAKGRFKRWVS